MVPSLIPFMSLTTRIISDILIDIKKNSPDFYTLVEALVSPGNSPYERNSIITLLPLIDAAVAKIKAKEIKSSSEYLFRIFYDCSGSVWGAPLSPGDVSLLPKKAGTLPKWGEEIKLGFLLDAFILVLARFIEKNALKVTFRLIDVNVGSLETETPDLNFTALVKSIEDKYSAGTNLRKWVREIRTITVLPNANTIPITLLISDFLADDMLIGSFPLGVDNLEKILSQGNLCVIQAPTPKEVLTVENFPAIPADFAYRMALDPVFLGILVMASADQLLGRFTTLAEKAKQINLGASQFYLQNDVILDPAEVEALVTIILSDRDSIIRSKSHILAELYIACLLYRHKESVSSNLDLSQALKMVTMDSSVHHTYPIKDSKGKIQFEIREVGDLEITAQDLESITKILNV